MAAGNPFFDVHDAIWDLLEDTSTATDLVASSKHFTNLVPAGQRIKFTGSDRQPLMDVASSADYEQVMVWGTQIVPRDRRASNATSLTLQWEVIVKSGEQPFDPFFDLQWAVIRQLLNWDSLKTSIAWGSENPVRMCDVSSASESLVNRGLNENLRGWSSVWVGTTDLWFSHANLIA